MDIESLRTLPRITFLKVNHKVKSLRIPIGKKRSISIGVSELIKLDTRKLTITILGWHTGCEYIYYGDTPSMTIPMASALRMVNERKLTIITEPTFVQIQ